MVLGYLPDCSHVQDSVQTMITRKRRLGTQLPPAEEEAASAEDRQAGAVVPLGENEAAKSGSRRR